MDTELFEIGVTPKGALGLFLKYIEKTDEVSHIDIKRMREDGNTLYDVTGEYNDVPFGLKLEGIDDDTKSIAAIQIGKDGTFKRLKLQENGEFEMEDGAQSNGEKGFMKGRFITALARKATEARSMLENNSLYL